MLVGGGSGLIAKVIFFGLFLSMFSSRKIRILALEQNKGMDFLSDLVAKGKLKIIIDKTFTLDNARDAFQYFADGKARRKIVIEIR